MALTVAVSEIVEIPNNPLLKYLDFPIKTHTSPPKPPAAVSPVS
jgi:hypothetical protein